MKIVALDAFTANPGDLTWTSIEALGDFTVYDRTPTELALERAKDAEILLINKFPLDIDIINQLPNLKMVSVIATGFNNVNVDYLAKKNIPVCNVVGYSSQSVAQHVFALILNLINRVEAHHQAVINGKWSNQSDFCFTLNTIHELAGQTMGIYGFGKIGRQVAKIAMAFGMKVIAHHKHPKRDHTEGVTFVPWEQFIKESDVLSLHAPLNADNKEIMNKLAFQAMKSNALLINTGRGGLVNELDLKEALESDEIAGAGLDVLSMEPPTADHPLIGVRNCLITPHIAWAGIKSRKKLIEETALNIKAFMEGNPRNVVN